MASAALKELCRSDPPLFDALRRLDREADDNPDAAAVIEGLEWIAAQPRSMIEKFDAIRKLTCLEGQVFIPSLAEFLGWEVKSETQKSAIERFIDEIVESKTIAAAVDSGALRISYPELFATFALLRCIDRGDAGAQVRDEVGEIVSQGRDVRERCRALLPVLRPLAFTLQ